MKRSEGLLLEPESIPVVSLHPVGLSSSQNLFLWVSLHPMGLLLEPESILYWRLLDETHRIQGLVYLFTLQGSGQAPLWYTPEKITVPKAWFTGSTCLALASSLEYILEVFLFYFSASFQSLVGFQLRDTSLNPESITTTRN
ncbi:hypothetical protein EVAR_20380_1 [Eumeta japonica]|uniref:Uncharacterized protein n=1 Tax=Eumeta variegata TaxID=151549 RepID=A0A4C1ZSU6_EUMVA|nr:hypothetical protein EVAR_20380_1 [Eumeta japonica]